MVATQNKGMAVLPDGIIMVSLAYAMIPSLLNLINQSFSFLGMKMVAQSLVTHTIPEIIYNSKGDAVKNVLIQQQVTPKL